MNLVTLSLMAKAEGISGGVRHAAPDGSGDSVVNLDVNSSKFNEQHGVRKRAV